MLHSGSGASSSTAPIGAHYYSEDGGGRLEESSGGEQSGVDGEVEAVEGMV